MCVKLWGSVVMVGELIEWCGDGRGIMERCGDGRGIMEQCGDGRGTH